MSELAGKPDGANLGWTLAEDNQFEAAALEANRAGRLSPYQIGQLRALARFYSLLALVVAGVGGLIAWVVLGDRNPSLGFSGALVVGGFTALICLYFLAQAGQVLLDAVRGRVAQLDGAVRHEIQFQRRTDALFFRVGARKFRVSKAAFNALPDGLPSRLYYAPLSHKLMSLEPVGEPGPAQRLTLS